MGLGIKVLLILAGLYLLLVLAAGAVQRRLIYFPDPLRISPAAAGLPAVKEEVLESAGGERVLAWYAPAAPGRPTILYYHGNGGSLVDRAERIGKYLGRGLGVFMMTYRGYGGSTGTPSEKANVADAKLAYDRLVARGVGPENIIVYGESLGTAVATQVAAARTIAGLVLDAPFTSMLDLAALHYPALPARWLLKDRYETSRFIGKVKAPLLILHGALDDIVPLDMGKAIHALANEPKEIVVFEGAGHIDHWRYGSYDRLYAWIDRLFPRQRL